MYGRGVRALAKLLDGSSVISLLELHDNQIHTEGAKSLARAFKNNKCLLSVNLRLNRMGDEGCKVGRGAYGRQQGRACAWQAACRAHGARQHAGLAAGRGGGVRCCSARALQTAVAVPQGQPGCMQILMRRKANRIQ